MSALRRCRNCEAVVVGVPNKTHGLLCPYCAHPLRSRVPDPPLLVASPPRVALQRTLEAADIRDFREYTRELARAEARGRERPDADEDFTTRRGQFLRSDVSYPLGPDMPHGRSLRDDGQSHRQAWAELVRGDPCSYCGEPVGGTVDHIEPQKGPHAAGQAEVHTWLNFTSSCDSCNGSKSNEKLLVWLAGRGVRVRASRVPKARNVARLERRGRTPHKDRRLEREAAEALERLRVRAAS